MLPPLVVVVGARPKLCETAPALIICSQDFSPGSMPGSDCRIRVTYPGFTVLAEVSTKRHPDERFFRKQLKQALDHADSLVRLGTGGIVYALVVNKCSVESNARMDGVYSRVLLRRMDSSQGAARE